MRCEDQHLAAWVLGAMFMCFLREVYEWQVLLFFPVSRVRFALLR